MNSFRRSARFGLVVLGAAILGACGGGTSSGSGSNFVSGVAATGLAISNAEVSLRCAAGTMPTVTTGTDGSYTIDVSNATLPCIARVSYSDKTGTHHLHSLVKTVGTVNITPFTDMVVSGLSGTGAAASTYDNFDAKEVAGYTQERVDTVMQMVKTRLAAEGVDPAKLPSDLISTRLKAAHGETAGDEQDQALDELHNRLTQQSTTLESMEASMHEGTEHNVSTSTGMTGDATAGAAAYSANCASCHGASVADARNAAKILEAIRENEGGMGALGNTVTATMANDIATYMGKLMSGGTIGTVKTSQTITFVSPGTQTLGSTPAALTASASSNLPVSIASTTSSVCTVSGTTLTLVAAGTCSLTASQTGNTTYSAAPSVTVSFTVLNASGATLTAQTISFSSPGAQTVGTVATLSATASSGLVVSLASSTPSVCTVSGNALTPVAAGTCTVTADQVGNAIYAAAPTVTQSVTVTSAVSTGTASATNGKTLYVSNSCGSCHRNPPSTLNVLNGANNPTLIRSAINNVGSMGGYAGLTDAQLADIAAYLATPNI